MTTTTDPSPEEIAPIPPAQWKHKPGGKRPACETAGKPGCKCACRGALHSRRLIDAVLKIPADLRPVYTDTPARPLTVAELLDTIAAARREGKNKNNTELLHPLGDDVVFTAARELVFAQGKCKQLAAGQATVREKTMLWCAFADLMTEVHALAPEDGSWWELSWQVRTGRQDDATDEKKEKDKAKELAGWINHQVGNKERNAASAETWPAMLTAAAVALAGTPLGESVTPAAIATVAGEDTMRRYIWPRKPEFNDIANVIEEMTHQSVVDEIARIIAAALNASDLAREDQLLVLRATAAGICSDPWRTPQVVRHALLPAVADLITREAPMRWMKQRPLSPADLIGWVLGDRWQGYSQSWLLASEAAAQPTPRSKRRTRDAKSN